MLAKRDYGFEGREEGELAHAEFVPFTAQTRMSGVDLTEDGQSARSARVPLARCSAGCATARTAFPPRSASRRRVSVSGGTPLVVAEADAMVHGCSESFTSRTSSRRE